MKVAGNNIFAKTLNIVLPLAGISFMVMYACCVTSCSHIKGAFLGIDLKWVGIIYMTVLFSSTFAVQEPFGKIIIHIRTALISMAAGVELYLIGFQVLKDIYCPFCLAFGACVFVLFGVNYTLMNKRLMLMSAAIALLGFTLCFEGRTRTYFDLSRTDRLFGAATPLYSVCKGETNVL
jgi:hypothetical protein